MRIVCGLDMHKESVFVCSMNENRDKFEAKYGGVNHGVGRVAAIAP